MVVEENRVSSNSTGSSLRISLDSTGSSNSQINEMEPGKLPPHSENVQNDDDGKSEKDIEDCKFSSLEEKTPKTNKSCLQESDSLEANNLLSLVSDDNNCASELMPQTDHSRSLDKCGSGDYVSKADLKADVGAIQAPTLLCKAEVHYNSDNEHTQSNELAPRTPEPSDSGIAIDVIVVDENKGIGDIDGNFEGAIGTQITNESATETDTDFQTNTDPYELELENECYEVISEYIPKGYWSTPLKCFSYKTVTDISYRLDGLAHAHGGTWCQDYTGLCERINLDHAFTK